jgi:ABC-2 type transport system ATP-binding protein
MDSITDKAVAGGRIGTAAHATSPLGISPAPPAIHPALLFEQVSKWYGPVIGVNQVTLELRPGITGLVGANGAGKSTLLRLATGQLRPDLGRVQVLGLEAWRASAKRHVGYCPEVDAFYEEMSGRQFVLSMARLCGYSLPEASARTENALHFVGMADRADRSLRGYSKGMRQRIKVAQALVHEPQVLVLDEPLSGVDPVGRQEFLDLFHRLAAAGKCLLVSSHELEELEKLTEQVAIMARGRIAAVGTVSQIRDRLDDHPLSILIEFDGAGANGGRSGNPLRQAAGLLLGLPDVAGVEMGEADKLIVRARNPRRFFADFTRLVLEEGLDVRRLETLDDSTHAVLNYLLGGTRD